VSETAERARGERTRIAVILAVVLVAWAVYAYGAFHSPVLDRELAERKAYLNQIAREARADLGEERRLAEAYWARYPDVANDRNFGRASAMGLAGAREHFNRHGKREGRVWGE
jgi:hypothetical protein